MYQKIKSFITGKTSDLASAEKEIFICLEILEIISFQSKKQLINIFKTYKKN